MISSFHPHSMCNKVQRLTAKTGCTSCTKQTISFEVSRFHTETRLLQRDFIFLNLFKLHSFSVFKIHHSKPTSSIYNPFRLHLLFFIHLLIILSYKTMKLKSIWNELWKGSKLAWYHHFTHIECAGMYKGLWQKLNALRVQNRKSPPKYPGFIRKPVCYKGISYFWTYLNSVVFLCSKCTIQSHITNLQPFPTSFVIFHTFTDYFEL